jgi:hypothetical protein
LVISIRKKARHGVVEDCLVAAVVFLRQSRLQLSAAVSHNQAPGVDA